MTPTIYPPCRNLSELKQLYEIHHPSIEGRSVKVLSLDGGGVRGIITAKELQWIEEQTHRKISEIFDLIVGTSTGGIETVALTVPESADSIHPKFSASDVVQLYRSESETIFPQTAWWKKPIQYIWDIENAEYDPKGLEDVMTNYCGETRLQDAITEVIIPSQEITQSKPWYFQRSISRIDPSLSSLKMTDVILSATAAPTYFPPHPMEIAENSYAFVDAGLSINNPTVTAYTEVTELFHTNTCLMVSLGTGVCTQKIPYNHLQHWGLKKWTPIMINFMMQSQSQLVHKQMKTLMPNTDIFQKYFRFQPKIDQNHIALDNSDPDNLQELENIADKLIEDEIDQYNQLVEQLMHEIEF